MDVRGTVVVVTGGASGFGGLRLAPAMRAGDEVSGRALSPAAVVIGLALHESRHLLALGLSRLPDAKRVRKEAEASETSALMALVTISAEVRVPVATAQLVRFDIQGPSDNIYSETDAYWLDLCLTPRPQNTRARYLERWGPHRFERVGPVFMLPPEHPLQFKSDGGRQASVVCQLRRDALRQWFEEDIDWTDRRLEASLDVSNANIRNLLLRLGHELRYPGFASEALTELVAAQLAIELGRYCTAIDETPAAGGLASWRLRVIDERLAEVREPPTLTEVAKLCNMSVRQLTRGFRASRGCSIGDYVAQSRIELAKRRLAGEQGIKAIAHSMGFGSPSSFSYAFRRATGITPRQFRQRVQRADS